MAADFVHAIFKRGDKITAPGKEYLGIKDGMLVTWHDPDVYDPKFSAWMQRVFFCVKLKRDLLPKLIAGVQESQNAADGAVDKKTYLARMAAIDIAEVERVAGISGLSADMASAEIIPELDLTAGSEKLIKVPTLQAPTVRDVMSVSSGAYGVGSGDDYSDWISARADIANLTNDLSFTQSSAFTLNGGSNISESLNGHALTFDSDTPPAGDPTSGLITSIDYEGYLFGDFQEGAGETVYEGLYWKRILAGSNEDASCITTSSVSTGFDLVIRKCMIDGNGHIGCGVRAADADVTHYIYNNVIWSFDGASGDAYGLHLDALHSSSVIENNTIYSIGGTSSAGIDAENNACTIRNNAVYDCTSCFLAVGSATGNNNAASDTTGEDGDFSSGSGNQSSRSAATDFESTTDTVAAFLNIASGGGLKYAGNATILGGNTTGIRGNTRPVSGENPSIGAAEVNPGSSSASASESGSESASPSTSESASESSSPSASESASPSTSESASPSASESGSESASESGSESASPSASESGSESASESGSESASESGSESTSPSTSESASESPSESGSESASESASPSASGGGSASESASESASYSGSASESASESASPSGFPTFDEAAALTVRKWVGRVTVYWGGALLDNIEVTWPGTVANWLMDEVPQLPPQIANGVDTVAYKWFRCDGVATLDDMVLAPGDEAAAALYEMGWWGGTFAGALGAFTDPQYLRLRLVEQAVATVTVAGDAALGEYPVDFTIKVFSGVGGSVLEDEVAVTGNAQVSRDVSVGPVSEATAVLLTITKWSDADAVIKISELFTSASAVYDGDEIMTMNVFEENEIKNATLPTGNIAANELELALNNVDDKFFPANDLAPYHAMVRKNRKIVAEIGLVIPDGGGTEYIAMGTYWSGDWKVSEGGTTASTTAMDRLGRLQKMTFSTSEVYFDYTIGQLIDVVMTAARLQMFDLEYEVDAELYGDDYTIPVAWFPKVSFFEALNTLSGACLGSIYVDRQDVIQCEAPAEIGAYEYELTADDYYERRQPEESESVENRIEVTTQPLRLDPDEGEGVEVYRSSEPLTLEVGESLEKLIEYSDKPVDGAVFSVEATDGSSFVGSVTVNNSYAWGAELTVECTTAGEFEIVAEGDLYTVDGKEVVVKIDNDSQFQYGEQRYALKDNPLIQTEALATKIAETLLETYRDPSRDIELNWRGNPNVKLNTVIRAPEYVRGAVSNKSDFVVFKQKTIFDGTLCATLSGRRVRETNLVVVQDTDGSGYDIQDTDDSGNIVWQD